MTLLQTPLVTIAEISQIIQISKSVNEDKLNELIIKAQFTEVMPLLGEELYNDVIQNIASYSDLLNGSTYTHNTMTYINHGLKAVIIYYVDAYYKMFGDATDTPFGLVNKLNGQESKPVDNAFKKSMFINNKQMAYNVWLSVEKYLILTENILFKKTKCLQKQTFKISKISR